MKKKISSLLFLGMMLLMGSCQMGKGVANDREEEGDTIALKYSRYLTLVAHGGYTEAILANPWKEGSELHRYLLVPKGKEGDEVAAGLSKQKKGQPFGVRVDVVRTPINSSVVYTAPHIQLMYELGCQKAVTGVCDLPYVNIADVKRRKDIVDCGSSMQPNVERIMALRPEALLISPFENSAGYGKLDKLGIPIIETADYMEISPLGRAEWIRFYGMLLGQGMKGEEERISNYKNKADSLFAVIEKRYVALKDSAARLPLGRSILTERKMGGVWYVPGGKSTTGILLRDAHARYVFASDGHNGSLALSPEQILARANDIDVWTFKYLGNPGEPSLGKNAADRLMTKQDLLQEYAGYTQLKAFRKGEIYECNTSRVPFFEHTGFHPERLLQEYILLAHPSQGSEDRLLFFTKLK